MDALEALMTARAIRRFRPDPVSQDDLWTCLKAAQQAPSGGNVQPVQYVVVQDAQQRGVVGGLYRDAYARYSKTLGAPTSFRSAEDEASWRRTRDASDYLGDHMADVPVHVLFLQPIIPWGGADAQGPLDIGRLDASVYPAVQNFIVAARALGLGTALTTVIRIVSTQTLEALGVPSPEKWEIAALLPVGYPVGRFGEARRKPVAAVTHWDRWGNRQK